MQAVEFVKKRLPDILCSRTDFSNESSITIALCEAFKDTDAELLRHLQSSAPMQPPASNAASYVLSSGCVACAAIVIKSVVHVANLGDCRAIMCSAGEMITLTVDHRPEGNDEERERLQNLGIESAVMATCTAASVSLALSAIGRGTLKKSAKDCCANPMCQQLKSRTRLNSYCWLVMECSKR